MSQLLVKLTCGKQELAHELLQRSRGGSVWNTAFIECLNGTFRERLAVLTRKCRHAARRLRARDPGMYLVGCTYNLCFPHHELSKGKHRGGPCTSAMAAGLSDHPWSILELLSYRFAQPPWVAPKRRGRPRTRPLPVATSSRQAVLRLRKGVLCPTPS